MLSEETCSAYFQTLCFYSGTPEGLKSHFLLIGQLKEAYQGAANRAFRLYFVAMHGLIDKEKKKIRHSNANFFNHFYICLAVRQWLL